MLCSCTKIQQCRQKFIQFIHLALLLSTICIFNDLCSTIVSSFHVNAQIYQSARWYHPDEHICSTREGDGEVEKFLCSTSEPLGNGGVTFS